jgi:hypothetical protein
MALVIQATLEGRIIHGIIFVIGSHMEYIMNHLIPKDVKFIPTSKHNNIKKVSHLLLRGTNYLEFLTLSCPGQFHVFQPQNKTLKSGSYHW